MAQSVSQIIPEVSRASGELQRHAVTLESSLTNQAFPTWYDPLDDSERSHLDPSRATEAFSRSALGEQFGRAISGESSGTTGDLSSIELQGAFLQSLEAAYRSRHLTFCRGMAHAASRAHGHAHENGPVHRALLGYFQFMTAKAKTRG